MCFLIFDCISHVGNLLNAGSNSVNLGNGPKFLHFQEAVRACLFHWSGDHTLSSNVLKNIFRGQRKNICRGVWEKEIQL